MVEKQISKIVSMATMTELVGEPAIGYDHETQNNKDYNLALIRSSFKLRYQRDP